MTKLDKKNDGFTIIEVVLVLAIAGLIFLIVFIALPQLQKSRRDTQRKSDTGLILAAMDSYASNHGGTYPEAMSDLNPDYIDDELRDPSTGEAYEFPDEQVAQPNWTNEGKDSSGTPAGELAYTVNTQCNGDATEDSDGNNNIAVLMKLESGQYCQDNS